MKIVPALEFYRLGSDMWALVKNEGLDVEFGVYRKDKWRWALYPLDSKTRDLVRATDDSKVNLYNEFDIALKAVYGKKYTTMIDYDAGLFCVLRCDGLNELDGKYKVDF